MFLLFVVQTLTGKLGADPSDALNWFLPTIMPSLSLIFAALLRDSFQRPRERRVRIDVFWIAIGLSAFYLALLIGIVLAEPFIGSTIVTIGATSGLYLGPLQGLVAGALGVFYASGSSDDSKAGPSRASPSADDTGAPAAH